MTIANFLVNERSVIAFSDTALCDTTCRVIGRVSKLHVLPHLSAVFIVRGPALFARDLADALAWDLGMASDLEAAIEAAPEIMRQRHQFRTEIGQQHHDHDPALYRCQLFLAGWSGRRDRPRFVTCESDSDFTLIERTPGIHLNPPPGPEVRLPATMTLEQAVATADAQRSMMRANADRLADGTGIGIGGELLAVEITRSGIQIKQVHRWNEGPEVAA